MAGDVPADTTPAARPADFRVGDWLVQPMLNRASRNGTVTHLRPQLMDLLVCLAQTPGRTVSREVLLEQVWRHQAVVDTALARCVAELRQVLGDNAQAPVFIETIAKRGYRLIAHVSTAEPEAAAGPLPHATGVTVDAASPRPLAAVRTASGAPVLSVVATALAHVLSVWTRRG